MKKPYMLYFKFLKRLYITKMNKPYMLYFSYMLDFFLYVILGDSSVLMHGFKYFKLNIL